MRLWSLHPRYLDSKGLVALWREGLLAQKVLYGETKGYRNHPQLERFKNCPDPKNAIVAYLHAVCDEADWRGYRFDRARIRGDARTAEIVPIADGQIAYELDHLKSKVKSRAPKEFEKLSTLTAPELHPSFISVPGPIAHWERP